MRSRQSCAPPAPRSIAACAVLPPDRRHAMYAIYAFCRMVDDIADEDGAFAAQAARADGVAGTRRRVCTAAQSDGPVTRVLAAAVQRFALRQEDFLAVIDGMQMDAETAIVAPDLATLDLYCDRVAAAVGRLSVRAFGDASPAADQVAYSLGRALQLTNILRDLQEDAERGRLYLPREWLDAAGVPHDPSAALRAPGLPAGLRARGRAGARRISARPPRRCGAAIRRAMKPARLMGATYAAILTRLERRGWSPPHERVSLPAWQKLWLALRYGLAQR